GLERAPRDETEAVLLAGRDHLELDRAVDQVVEALLRDEAEEVPLASELAGAGDVPAGEIRGADVDDLALADQDLHRLPDLVPGRPAIDVMHLVEVDRVGLEPLERALARADDVERGEPRLVRPVSHRSEDLGREDDLLAAAAALREPAADDLLGPAFALLP